MRNTQPLYMFIYAHLMESGNTSEFGLVGLEGFVLLLEYAAVSRLMAWQWHMLLLQSHQHY